jgi:cell division protein FtsB
MAPQNPDGTPNLLQLQAESGVASAAMPLVVADPPGASVTRRDIGPDVKTWLFRILVVIGLAYLIGYLPLQLFGEKGLAQYRRLDKELKELKVRNAVVSDGIRDLRLEIHRLRDDDTAMEKAAREDLGMVKAGELIFVIED